MAKVDLTAQRLRELLDYDAQTGVMRWRQRPASSFGSFPAYASFLAKRCGCVAGSLKRDGYIHITIGGKAHAAHRLAWLHVTDNWPARTIDHINGNRSDNRLTNLREVSQAENNQNVRFKGLPPSGARGVSWVEGKKRWRATISVNGKVRHLGLHKTIEAAEAAYIRAKAIHHPFSAAITTGII